MNYKKTLLTLLFSLFLQLGFAQLPKVSFHSCESSVLAPGKNIELKVTLINDGEVATENDTHVTLKCDSKYITIVNAEAICKPLAPNATQEVVFTITANELLTHDSDISFSIESVLKESSIESYLYYDFEDGIQGWNVIDADGDGFNWIESGKRLGVGYGHESQYCLFSQSYDNTFDILYPDNYLVTPEKFKLGKDAAFSFWACAQDREYPAEHFGFAISTTDGTSADDFSTIKEWTMTAKGNRDQGTWYQYTVDLKEYEGQEVWMALRHFDCFDQYFLAVDDIELTGVMQPMKWNNEFSLKGNNPQENIVVEAISHEDFAAGKEMNLDVTFVNNGLKESSYQAKAVLSTDDEFVTITQGEHLLEPMACNEKVTHSFSFTTDASMPDGHIVTFNIDISANETFDESIDITYSFNNDFEGWTTINANNDDHLWYHTSESDGHFVTMIPSHSGKGHLMSESFCNIILSELMPDDYIVSPFMIHVKEETTFGFWAAMQDKTVPGEHFGVAVSTKGSTSADDFTTIEEWTLTSDNRLGEEWTYFSVDLSEYVGQNIWLAIRHFNSTDIFILCIDDISISNFSRHPSWRHTFTLQNGTSLTENDKDFCIYPNPVKDRLYIETESEIEEVIVYDIYGRHQVTETPSHQEMISIDISNLNSGVYFVKINTAEGNIVKRFVKEL